jgi:crotonobetainyl-CoA:carnitine CoA-transferase CaiB-like acyl-CoA transferase
MYDAIIAMCENVVYNYAWDGRVLEPKGSGHPALCPFDVFETSDGAVAIAAPTPHHFNILAAIMDRVDLIDNPKTHDNLARVANRAEVIEIVSSWTRTRTKAQVVAELGGRVPVGPVNTAEDIFSDPHVAARGMLTEIELPGGATVRLPSPPLHFASTPAKIYRRPPKLNEHRDEILEEIGVNTRVSTTSEDKRQ